MIVAFILTSYALVFLWLAHDRQVLAAQLQTMRKRMDRVDEAAGSSLEGGRR